jgi:hypothetical protein
MQNQVTNNSFETKINKVKSHLQSMGSITSWQAISLYRATRLSAIIFILRKNGWNITSVRMEDGESKFVKYIYTKQI